MINILFVNGGPMNRGGIESFMMNYYRHIDSSKVHIDFIVHGDTPGAYDDEIVKSGSIIYRVPIKSRHPFKYKREMCKIFSLGKYDIVHSHVDAMSTWILKMAKQCGIKIRIAHSHNTEHLTTNKIKYALNEYARKNIRKYATHCFACGEAAGNWLFGKGNYSVIQNAIELERFLFSESKREEVRSSLGINDDTILMGHVGRFDTQKNHEFLITVFAEIKKKRSNVKLMLIGSGWKEESIKSLVESKGIADSVYFMGNRNDVNELYNAMDCYVFPSLFEGLPVVLVEAQANGLKCYLSNTITKEVAINDRVEYIPLDKAKWVEILTNNLECSRLDAAEDVKKRGYDISLSAKKLEGVYLKLEGSIHE